MLSSPLRSRVDHETVVLLVRRFCRSHRSYYSGRRYRKTLQDLKCWDIVHRLRTVPYISQPQPGCPNLSTQSYWVFVYAVPSAWNTCPHLFTWLLPIDTSGLGVTYHLWGVFSECPVPRAAGTHGYGRKHHSELLHMTSTEASDVRNQVSRGKLLLPCRWMFGIYLLFISRDG